MNVDKLILWALIVLTLCRFVLTGHSDLSPQESLWWMQSQRLTWSYLDNGPLMPAFIRISTHFIQDLTHGLRFWNPLLILLSTYWLYLIARSACNQTTARWTVVVFNMLPMVNFAAIRQLDVAAGLCFGLLTLWLFWCSLHRAKPGHWIWWLAGWSLALCGLLQLTLSLYIITPLLIITVIPRWRRQWRRRGILILCGVGLSLALVCVIRYGGWKFLVLVAQHHWMHLGFHPLEALQSFAKALLVTGPLLIAGAWWMQRQWRLGWSEHGLQFLTVATLGPILTAATLSFAFAEPVLLWWFGLTPGLIVVIHTWMQSDVSIETRSIWRQRLLAATTVITLLGIQPELIRAIGIPWPYAWDATQDQYGWRKSGLILHSALQQWEEERQSKGLQGQPQFVIADSPATAAALDAHLPPNAPVIQPHPDYPRVHVIESAGLAHQYHLWPNYSHAFNQSRRPFKGQHALYVTNSTDGLLPPEIRHAFQSTEVASVIAIQRQHQPLMRWTFYHCREYIGLPL